jgi:APA family basic amino acid/polyamine antiporter
MLALPPANWWRLLLWLLVGFYIYYRYGRHHSVLAKERAKEKD